MWATPGSVRVAWIYRPRFDIIVRMKMSYVSQAKYCEEYMRYLGIAKTERRSYAESVRLLKAKGFKDISAFKSLKAGDRVYRGYEDRTVMAAVIGKRRISEAGIKVVGGHTDAPRLDLKPKPLYEKGGCVYFDCHIYGGIKKYQWLTLPLALYGTIVRTDGTKVQVAVGDEPGDPVFLISDILPHLGKDQAEKKRDEFFPAEDLDVVCWTTGKGDEGRGKGDEKGSPKSLLVEYLKKAYKVSEEDLLSAELEIVPDGDLDLGAVLAHDRAVQRQRQRQPLVLLDAAVHVAVEIDAAALFVKRLRLEIEPRRVRVAADDLEPRVGDLLPADHRRHHRAVLVTAIDLVARLENLERGKLLETARLQKANALGIAPTLRLRNAQISHILCRVFLQRHILHFHGEYNIKISVFHQLRVRFFLVTSIPL